MDADAAYELVDAAVDEYLRQTEELEQELFSLWEQDPGDQDVETRIGGIALLHLGAAADVAELSRLDGVPGDAPVSSVPLPETANTLGDIAFRGGEMVSSLGSDPDDEEADDDQEEELDVSEVVQQLVDSAGGAATKTLFGLVSGPLAHLASGTINDLIPTIHRGMQATPDAIKDAVGRFVNLVRRFFRRVKEAIQRLTAKYRDQVHEVMDEVDPTDRIAESLGGRAVAKFLDADDVRRRAADALRDAPDHDARVRKIRKLVRSQDKWVAKPVGAASKGLPKLWPVLLGPVPAAPVGAVVLIAWTYLMTSDQLDSRRALLNCWKGVVRRAEGE